MSSNGKPTPQPPAAGGNGAGGPPKMYQRPIYRPQQGPAKRRRGGRSCPFSCCCCFFWTVLVILLLAFIAAVVGGAFYLLYRPHRPAFTLSVARVTKLSVSSSATAPAVTDAIDVTLTARNPNKKLVYFYDDFAVTAATAANAVPLGEGSVPGFAHEAGNITVIKATVSASALAIDPAASSDIKKSGEFPITVDLETKAGVKVGGLKTKKIGTFPPLFFTPPFFLSFFFFSFVLCFSFSLSISPPALFFPLSFSPFFFPPLLSSLPKNFFLLF
jgi:hypothetical protein